MNEGIANNSRIHTYSTEMFSSQNRQFFENHQLVTGGPNLTHNDEGNALLPHHQ